MHIGPVWQTDYFNCVALLLQTGDQFSVVEIATALGVNVTIDKQSDMHVSGVNMSGARLPSKSRFPTV